MRFVGQGETAGAQMVLIGLYMRRAASADSCLLKSSALPKQAKRQGHKWW